MEEQNTVVENPKTPKRGLLFLIAIIIGLLFGVVATLLVVDLLQKRQTTIVQMVSPDSTKTATSDTIVKYVIHKYEQQELEAQAAGESDFPTDSTVAFDESEDFMMEDAEPYGTENVRTNSSMAAEQMIGETNVKITYLDNNKEECAVPAHQPASVKVQYWKSMIKNKLSYQFNTATLILKGLAMDHCKIFHYKGNFYLESNHRFYLIHHNSQQERLVETHEFSL